MAAKKMTDAQVTKFITGLAFTINPEIITKTAYSSLQRVKKGADTAFCLVKYTKSKIPDAEAFKKAMFEDNINSVPGFEHENISRVSYVGESSRTFFVVCRYVKDGENAPDFQFMCNMLAGAVPEAQYKPWLQSVAKGLAELHSKGYAHRNLNLTNVILATDTSAMLLGYSCRKNANQDDGFKNVEELFRPLTAAGAVDHFKDDVWTFGAMMFVMACKESEFRVYREDEKMLKHGIEMMFRGSQLDMMNKMMAFNPTDRITMAEVLAHPYWTEAIKEPDAQLDLGYDPAEFPEGKPVEPEPEPAFRVNFSQKTKAVLEASGVELVRYISDGAYGAVFEVQLSGETLKDYAGEEHARAALKVANLDSSPNYRETLSVREREFLQNVRHECLIKFIRLFMDDENMFIIMELAPNCLQDYIEENHPVTKGVKANMVETRMKPLLYDVCVGMTHLHTVGWAHRDMKPLNVLIKSNGRAAICDFSFARPATANLISESWLCTPYYGSPQIILHFPYKPFSADVWALGVTFYNSLTSLTLIEPDMYSTRVQIFNEFESRTNKVLNSPMDPDARDLVYNMLCFDESERWTMEQVMESNFFKGMRTVSVGQSGSQQAIPSVPGPSTSRKSSTSPTLGTPTKSKTDEPVAASPGLTPRVRQLQISREHRFIEPSEPGQIRERKSVPGPLTREQQKRMRFPTSEPQSFKPSSHSNVQKLGIEESLTDLRQPSFSAAVQEMPSQGRMDNTSAPQLYLPLLTPQQKKTRRQVPQNRGESAVPILSRDPGHFRNAVKELPRPSQENLDASGSGLYLPYLSQRQRRPRRRSHERQNDPSSQ